MLIQQNKISSGIDGFVKKRDKEIQIYAL